MLSVSWTLVVELQEQKAPGDVTATSTPLPLSSMGDV